MGSLSEQESIYYIIKLCVRMKFQRFYGKHFCRLCEKEIHNGVYYVHVDDIDLVKWSDLPAICSLCHEVNHGQDMRCWRCNRDVDSDQTSVDGRLYHRDCYVCRTCKWDAATENSELSLTGYCQFCETETRLRII